MRWAIMGDNDTYSLIYLSAQRNSIGRIDLAQLGLDFPSLEKVDLRSQQNQARVYSPTMPPPRLTIKGECSYANRN